MDAEKHINIPEGDAEYAWDVIAGFIMTAAVTATVVWMHMRRKHRSRPKEDPPAG